MLVDARQLEPNASLEADIIVVGAGPAGITLARECARQGHSVLLLESGGFNSETDVQAICHGEAVGEFSPDDSYLSYSRRRVFGGTSSIWNGWCRPLDTLDFSVRNWVTDSGWPIERAELIPYYARATTVCQLSDFDAALYERPVREPSLGLRPANGLKTEMFHFSPPTRFGVTYRRDLVDDARTRVVLHANVLDVRVNDAGTDVDRLDLGTLQGERFVASARVYVLACGGVENARLLLLSRSVHKTGLGNDHDLVGRYFMEHPHVGIGTVVLRQNGRRLAAYEHRDGEPLPVLCPSTEAQRAERILNFSIQLNVDPTGVGTPGARAVGTAARQLDRYGVGGPGRTRSALTFASLYMRAEQAPNPNSRVTLSDDVDNLGQRRAKLDWRFSSLDHETFEGALRLVGRAFGAAGLGRVREAESPPVGTGHHQMGTTRCHDDPRRGVVDRHCRMHGVSNLFVAGSSVFPATGYANPTLTIVALAIRLADRLGEVVPAMPSTP